MKYAVEVDSYRGNKPAAGGGGVGGGGKEMLRMADERESTKKSSWKHEMQAEMG